MKKLIRICRSSICLGICLGIYFSSLCFSLVQVAYSAPAPTAGSTTPPAPIESVPVPCLHGQQLQQARIDLQSCEKVLKSSPYNTVMNSSFRPESIPDSLTRTLENRIKCYYKGRSVDTFQEVDGKVSQKNLDKNCDAGDSIYGEGEDHWTICSIGDGEEDSNHLNLGCGCKMDDNGGQLAGSCSRLGEHFRETGWERSQFLGLWVRAVRHFSHEVIQEEMMGRKLLRIHPYCETMARDYLRVMEKAHDISNRTLGSASFIPPVVHQGGVNFCTARPQDLVITYVDPQGRTETIDLAKTVPKGVACYLSVSRENRILMFSALGQCEVFARMNDFFVQVGGEVTRDFNGVIKGCIDRAVAEGNRVGHEIGKTEQDGIDAGNEEMIKCYKPAIIEFFKRTVRSYVPKGVR